MKISIFICKDFFFNLWSSFAHYCSEIEYGIQSRWGSQKVGEKAVDCREIVNQGDGYVRKCPDHYYFQNKKKWFESQKMCSEMKNNLKNIFLQVCLFEQRYYPQSKKMFYDDRLSAMCTTMQHQHIYCTNHAYAYTKPGIWFALFCTPSTLYFLFYDIYLPGG